MVARKIPVAMRDAKLVLSPDEPAVTIERVELILLPQSHSGVDYRMDESLPLLAQALSG